MGAGENQNHSHDSVAAAVESDIVSSLPTTHLIHLPNRVIPTIMPGDEVVT